MKTSADYIQAIKAAHNISSDSGVARVLGVTRQAISRLQNGEDSFSDQLAVRVAELIDADAEEIIISAHLQRAMRSKHPAAVPTWEKILKRAGYAAGVVLVAGATAGAPAPAQGAQAGANSGGICIMSPRRRRGFRPSDADPHRYARPAIAGLFAPT